MPLGASLKIHENKTRVTNTHLRHLSHRLWRSDALPNAIDGITNCCHSDNIISNSNQYSNTNANSLENTNARNALWISNS
jgi:hypothetical protein